MQRWPVRNFAVTCNPGNLKSTICNLKLRAEPTVATASPELEELKISDWRFQIGKPLQSRNPGKMPFFAIFAPPLRSSRLKAF